MVAPKEELRQIFWKSFLVCDPYCVISWACVISDIILNVYIHYYTSLKGIVLVTVKGSEDLNMN